jgi:NADPH-dependent 2,4-dienoyl-CoA reductase/sulfur reductase-like enzyme
MNIIILGNGISGITAARHIRKLSNHSITIISEETDYFFARTALMYVYMGHQRFVDTQPYEKGFWQKNRIVLRKGRVESIDYEHKTLIFKDKQVLNYDKLILAVGSKPNKWGWAGEDLDGVHGLYHVQDLEAMERHTRNGLKQVVIVGGGLIGIEMAEMFHSRGLHVTFLVREKSFWGNVLPTEESHMINRHILKHGIDLRLNTELKSILDDGTGKCRAVITNQGEEIPCQFVGLTAGVRPNVDFLKHNSLIINDGIVVNDFLETNITDVYAIGDCAEIANPQAGRRPIEAVWYTGRMMGETVAYNVCGQQIPYCPGIWFNSAKFLDIEYQVYGDITSVLLPYQETLFWEHPDGEKSIRLVFDKNSKQIIGFNLMGIRYRQEVCQKWIQQHTPIEKVLEELSLANFDPEFFAVYEPKLLEIYAAKTGKIIVNRSKRGLNLVLKFLKWSA